MKKLKKKKKKISSGVYIERLRRWISIKEAVDRDFHPENYDDEVAVNDMKDTPIIVTLLKDFFELHGGHPPNGSSEEGWYDGFVDFLIEEGANPQKYIGPDKNMLSFVNAAWQLYRKEHPFTPPKLELEGTSSGFQPLGKRKKIFGHPTTAIIRWMGREMWDFQEAKTALDKLEIDVSETTIRIQLRAGLVKDKTRGEPAELSDEEINILFECLDE